MLEYLSRYTHRTAISNERIRLINGSQVVFTVRGDSKGGKPGAKRTVRLGGPDRCGLVSVLRSGSFARHGGAGGSWALAWARPFTRARVPGAAVTAWHGATNQWQFAGPFDAGRVGRAWRPYGRAWIARRRAAHSLGRAMDANPIA